MRHTLLFCLALALACPLSPAEARDVVRLTPSTPWNLHYADDSCRLIRRFGQGKQQITLLLDQFEPGDSFRMMLGGDMLRPRSGSTSVEGAARFGPQEDETEITVETGTIGKERALFVKAPLRLAPYTDAESEAFEQARRNGTQITPEPIGTVREAAATWFQLGGILRNDLLLATGPMDRPLAVLRQCSWDTVKMWGLDIDQQKSLTRRPQPKVGPEKWFHSSDYPLQMIRGGYQGIVNFRMMINAQGKVTSCHIQQSTRPKEFDDVVCRIAMRRAEFEPALDAQGKPVPSYWRQTVHFTMPQ